MADTSIANVDISTYTWQQFITRLNDIVYAINTEVVTANTLANGSITTGNGIVNGVFGSTTLFASSSLRGGNVQSNATLVISSNVSINNSIIVSGQVSTTNTNLGQIIDSSNTSNYRTAKYVIQVTNVNGYQSTEIMLIHDGINTYLTEYATLKSNGSLGTFSANISSGNMNLLFNPVVAVNTVNFRKDAVAS